MLVITIESPDGKSHCHPGVVASVTNAMASAGVLIRPLIKWALFGHPKSWILGDYFMFVAFSSSFFFLIFKVESEPLQH